MNKIMIRFAILLISLFLSSCSKEVVEPKFCWECQTSNGVFNNTTTICDKTEVEILEYEREQDEMGLNSYLSGLLSHPTTTQCYKK